MDDWAGVGKMQQQDGAGSSEECRLDAGYLVLYLLISSGAGAGAVSAAVLVVQIQQSNE